ncbi:NAD(P)-dependent dehydrogenase (short-subunit alcohol dehydrogenase family) [Nocardia transvalensis]|uniref:NAD(P)-dependent dehydrogenase (Short-subunit alcohol dehydrogenase family) n=1 Tax=Nocardia transvalensis TaxID=37333 RepID=A0A7W9UJ37_9NOCA|nr:short chain dehydrogenase [Nocardia transvalensis]MBB5915033.1 NAD(P)-dependent dehydrogenase (short-subunit alcohol dehydrogenase family) [Nocardia transvalensis]
MRIIVIGATGTIGAQVAAELEREHEIVRASRTSEVRVDMDDTASIDALFETVPDVDAVICCAASGKLTPLDSGDDFYHGIQGKLFGQVHLVRTALRHLRDGGSITLTSGVFDRPEPGMTFGALVNGGLEAFVTAAATELPRGLRINTVSPGWITETLESMGRDGADGTPAHDVARAYVEAVQGTLQGQTLRPTRVGVLTI